MQRTSRAKWLWAAVLSSAFLAGAPLPSVHAQRTVEDQKTDRYDDTKHAQLATVEQLKHEAFKQLRSGNFDRSDELIRAAASMQADDQTLAMMSRWIGQYKSQRSEFVAERHTQYEKVVADVKKLLDAGKDPFAIDKATEAYTLADKKDNFSNEPWVADIVRRGETLGKQYESNEHWIKARRIWSDLAIIEPANPQWKERLNAANRRARLLAMYAPDSFSAFYESDVKERQEAEAVLKGPSTQPATTQPTTKPLAGQRGLQDRLA